MSHVRCACALGRHYGARGAAGLLLIAPHHVLLQHRSSLVDHPGTWSVPGGAIERGEAPEHAAYREASEELAGFDPAEVLEARTVRTVDHGAWTYTLVLARVEHATPMRPRTREATAVEWFTPNEVAALALHPLMREAWTRLRRPNEESV